MFNKHSRRTAAAVAATAASILVLSGCAGSGPEASDGAEFDPDAEATVSFTWWGNDDRAAKYTESIALFEEEYPNITVNGTFTDYPSYWEKRTTEAAGGGLPDVMQFDYSQMDSFGSRGLLYDLTSEIGSNIDVDGITESALSTGQIDDATFGLIASTNAWAMFQDTTLISSIGAEPYPGGTTWAEYYDWMSEVTEKGNGVYGGGDPTQRIQNFELYLRQSGGNVYTEDGELGFDEKDLTTFWESADEIRDGAIVPQQRLEELNPVSGFGANLAASELTWDNFGAGYLADSGKSPDDLVLTAPPTDDDSVKDLYLKPSMLLAMSSKTENAAAGAKLIDFLTNSPEVGKIFGASRGIPASETQRDGADLQGQDAKVLEYEEAIADRIGDAPPLPPEGAASIEQKFWDLGKSIGLGAVTVDDAVTQFFAEAEITLNN
jgi:ABC-type glycerol-3-phosphate transport system substrate-binding protein